MQKLLKVITAIMLTVAVVCATGCHKEYVVNATAVPSDGGSVEGSGSYPEGGYCTLTATANQGYTFTYWTVNGNVVSANPTYRLMVTSNIDLVANFAVPSASSYIDLGLPSGTFWATWNVGAASPEGYGDYFAWGETTPKDFYNWSTYQYCNNGSSYMLTKYCNNASYGNNGFTDDMTTLMPEDDAAAVNWGNGWRMPTEEEFQELYNNTIHTWTQQNGVNGFLFTAANGNSLFFPAAGFRADGGLYLDSMDGLYWSNSLHDLPDLVRPDFASRLCFGGSENVYMAGNYRDSGHSVRAVLPATKTSPCSVKGGTSRAKKTGG